MKVKGWILTGMIVASVVSETCALPRLTEVWESGTVFDVPECVCLDDRDNILFVSNVAGSPTEKNGRGFISRVGLDGTVLDIQWASGLNAPKGLAVSGDSLYVADIDRLVEIDRKTGNITAVYPAAGAIFLNDVAADDQGRIYTGDSSADHSVIYRLADGRLNVWLESPALSQPNGMLIQDGRLLVGNGDNGLLHSVDLNSRQVSLVLEAPTAIDGLQPVHGGYLISDWKGKITWIDASGSGYLLQDTTGNFNAADFAWIHEQQLLVVPTFFDNRLRAYQIEQPY